MPAVKAVFAITGVCEPGSNREFRPCAFPGSRRSPSGALGRLQGSGRFLLSQTEGQCGTSKREGLFRSERCMGGASIVNSMLAAVARCARSIPEWTHIVFCAMQDVPLAPKTVLLSALSGDCR